MCGRALAVGGAAAARLSRLDVDVFAAAAHRRELPGLVDLFRAKVEAAAPPTAPPSRRPPRHTVRAALAAAAAARSARRRSACFGAPRAEALPLPALACEWPATALTHSSAAAAAATTAAVAPAPRVARRSCRPAMRALRPR